MQYRNILLIDDDDDDQEIFLAAIEYLNNEVNCDAFSYAAEALQKLRSKEIDPDLIFLDLNMPVMNGQQFLVEVKKSAHLKDIPVIIFSTSSDNKTIQLMKLLGAQDFITKPEKYDQLIDILKPLLI